MILLSFDDVALLFGFFITIWVHLLLLFGNREKYHAWDIFFGWIIVSFVGYMTKTSQAFMKYEEIISSAHFFSLSLQFSIDLIGLLAVYGIRIPSNSTYYEYFLIAGALIMDLIHCCDENPFLNHINGLIRLTLFLFIYGGEDAHVQSATYLHSPDMELLSITKSPNETLDLRMNIFLVTHYVLYAGNVSIIPLLIIHIILWRFRYKRIRGSNQMESGTRR
jgi:hypothetical protein